MILCDCIKGSHRDDRITSLTDSVRNLLAANDTEARYYLALAVQLEQDNELDLPADVLSQVKTYTDAVKSIGLDPAQYLAGNK